MNIIRVWMNTKGDTNHVHYILRAHDGVEEHGREPKDTWFGQRLYAWWQAQSTPRVNA